MLLEIARRRVTWSLTLVAKLLDDDDNPVDDPDDDSDDDPDDDPVDDHVMLLYWSAAGVIQWFEVTSLED